MTGDELEAAQTRCLELGGTTQQEGLALEWAWGHVVEVQNVTTPGQLAWLLEHPCGQLMRSVSIEGLEEDADEIVSLLASTTFPRSLRRLRLNYDRIGDEGAKAVAGARHLGQLTHLDLRSNEIGDDGANAIASAKYLGQLTTLELRDNEIGDEGREALRSSPHLRHASIDQQRSCPLRQSKNMGERNGHVRRQTHRRKPAM